jgi:hypothetical protein
MRMMFSDAVSGRGGPGVPADRAGKSCRRAGWALLGALLATPAQPSSAVRGTVTEFQAPGGAVERCVALAPMPGAEYTDADARKEAEFCGIDFHAGTHALCPKVFSTSPGTLVYALAGGPYAGNPGGFEAEACGRGGVKKGAAEGEPMSYKMSVNTRETSATFANSALVYYHLARYFRATAHVPVAVFRTIDRQAHARRVTARGVSLSAGRSNLRMNHAAWLVLQAAEQDPSSYRPAQELFTPDGLLYGAMLHPSGRRYSEEMNGTRESGWGDGQNRDFQLTAPFRALRAEGPLADAIRSGVRAAMRDSKLAKASGGDVAPEQMAFWMSDLVDITLLDFILSQQDRIGNIDYVPFWYWREDGRLMSRPASGSTPPADIAGRDPAYIKRTELGDNDAGVRTSYANFAKRTGMLENLRHYRASAYEQLMRLDHDLQAEGPLHEYIRNTFGLSDREFAQLAANASAAAASLRDACNAGQLSFDVEPEEFLLTGTVVPRSVDCDAP